MKNRNETNKKRLLKTFIFTLFMLLFVGILFIIYSPYTNTNLKDIIFIVFSYFIFIYAEIFLIKEYVNIQNWTIEYLNYGKVIDKYRSYGPNDIDIRPKKSAASRKNTTSHIIVLVHEKKLNINNCTNYIYHNININDKVIVFMTNKKLYIAPK